MEQQKKQQQQIMSKKFEISLICLDNVRGFLKN